MMKTSYLEGQTEGDPIKQTEQDWQEEERENK